MTTTAESRPDLFLPEPEPREVKYTIISVDDHLVEPPHMFEGRLPKKLQDGAPRIIENEQGTRSGSSKASSTSRSGRTPSPAAARRP